MEYKLADPHQQCKQTIKLLETQLKLMEIERNSYKEEWEQTTTVLIKKANDVLAKRWNKSDVQGDVDMERSEN